MSQCNKCQAEIIWPKEFKPGNRPLNPDSTLHQCMKTGPSESKPAQASTPETKTPNTALEECIVFSETFKDVDAVRFDSLARIYNTLRMRR